MSIVFTDLKEISKSDLIQLMNEPLIFRHLPLASSHFNEEDYEHFIQKKEAMWKKYGYGPWAIKVHDKFIGWGGLQPIDSDVELALIIHPSHWGYGKIICKKMIQYAFEDLELNSIIILFPLSRKHKKSLFRFGFIEDGNIIIEGKQFSRYRLFRS